MQGANDGLNTVIPYNQKYYYKLRPIALKNPTITEQMDYITV